MTERENRRQVAKVAITLRVMSLFARRDVSSRFDTFALKAHHAERGGYFPGWLLSCSASRLPGKTVWFTL
jgi:hypothetical protein